MSQYCGTTPTFGKGHGEYYFLGSRDNPVLNKPKYIGGKRYIRYSIRTTKCDARKVKEGLKSRGNLSVVVPMKLWVKRRGYELGIDKIPAWVVYVHYKNALIVEV